MIYFTTPNFGSNSSNTTNCTIYTDFDWDNGTTTGTGTYTLFPDYNWDNGTTKGTSNTPSIVPYFIFPNFQAPVQPFQAYMQPRNSVVLTGIFPDNGTSASSNSPPSIVPYFGNHNSVVAPRARNLSEEQEQQKKEAAKIAAEEKAKVLLLELLDNENIQKYKEKKPLEIISKLFGDIKYLIPISKYGRIQACKEKNIISELCVVINEELPTADIILSRFLYTSYDEENMLRVANHFNVKENLLEKLNLN